MTQEKQALLLSTAAVFTAIEEFAAPTTGFVIDPLGAAPCGVAAS